MAARGDGVVNVISHPIGDQKFRVLRPAIVALGKANLILAQRFAMGIARILLVRRAEPDMAIDNNKCRRIIVVLECVEGLDELLGIVGVADSLDDPVVAAEAGRDVLTERE